MVLEILRVVEEAWPPDIFIMGDILETAARRLHDRHLERVLALCAHDAARGSAGARRALDHVAQLLLSDSFRGEAERRVRLLARCLGVAERLARPLPCQRALRLLRNASLSAPPPVRFGALPLEVMAHIEDFAPMLPEDRAVVAASTYQCLCALVHVPSYPRVQGPE